MESSTSARIFDLAHEATATPRLIEAVACARGAWVVRVNPSDPQRGAWFTADVEVERAEDAQPELTANGQGRGEHVPATAGVQQR